MACCNRHLWIPVVSLCLSATEPQPPAPPADPAPWILKVTGPDESPVPQATVWLLGEKGAPTHTVVLTNEVGEARLRPPKEGVFLVRVGKGGFRLKEKTVRASREEAPPVVIQLEPAA
jgi:hypothetical protein